MDEEELDSAWREAARAYHEPPATPRDEMWQAIQHREPRPASRSAQVRLRPWLPLAAAAVLALGIGIGRLSNHSDGSVTEIPAVQKQAARLNPTAYRLAAVEHLGQSEEFLTLFRTSVSLGTDERLASATARQLLVTDRLLLDSPAASDPKLRVLLEDLELVLAEIAQLAPEPRPQDVELIRRGIERGGVLSRLRTAVPAGTTPTRGAL
jgi:hypothetical protein